MPRESGRSITSPVATPNRKEGARATRSGSSRGKTAIYLIQPFFFIHLMWRSTAPGSVAM